MNAPDDLDTGPRTRLYGVAISLLWRRYCANPLSRAARIVADRLRCAVGKHMREPYETPHHDDYFVCRRCLAIFQLRRETGKPYWSRIRG